jgi:hypothetical protein
MSKLKGQITTQNDHCKVKILSNNNIFFNNKKKTEMNMKLKKSNKIRS